jgi:hypothetical protein
MNSMIVILVLFLHDSSNEWSEKLNLQVNAKNCQKLQNEAVQKAKATFTPIVAICEYYAGESVQSSRIMHFPKDLSVSLPNVPSVNYSSDTIMCSKDSKHTGHCQSEFPD